jgi:hypothetical protein
MVAEPAARHLLMVHHHAGFFDAPVSIAALVVAAARRRCLARGRRVAREILALGNPLVWWASIAALTHVAFKWLRAKSLTGPEGIILAGFVRVRAVAGVGRHRRPCSFSTCSAVPLGCGTWLYGRSPRSVPTRHPGCRRLLRAFLVLFVFYFAGCGADRSSCMEGSVAASARAQGMRWRSPRPSIASAAVRMVLR